MARTIQDPTGDSWRVGVEGPRLLPRWRGSVRGGLEVADAGTSIADLPFIGTSIAAALLAVAVLAIVGFLVLPALIFVVEAVLLVGAATWRFLHRTVRREWNILVVGPVGRKRFRVGSFRDARRAVSEVSELISLGSSDLTPSGAVALDDA